MNKTKLFLNKNLINDLFVNSKNLYRQVNIQHRQLLDFSETFLNDYKQIYTNKDKIQNLFNFSLDKDFNLIQDNTTINNQSIYSLLKYFEDNENVHLDRLIHNKGYIIRTLFISIFLYTLNNIYDFIFKIQEDTFKFDIINSPYINSISSEFNSFFYLQNDILIQYNEQEVENKLVQFEKYLLPKIDTKNNEQNQQLLNNNLITYKFYLYNNIIFNKLFSYSYFNNLLNYYLHIKIVFNDIDFKRDINNQIDNIDINEIYKFLFYLKQINLFIQDFNGLYENLSYININKNRLIFSVFINNIVPLINLINPIDKLVFLFFPTIEYDFIYSLYINKIITTQQMLDEIQKNKNTIIYKLFPSYLTNPVILQSTNVLDETQSLIPFLSEYLQKLFTTFLYEIKYSLYLKDEQFTNSSLYKKFLSFYNYPVFINNTNNILTKNFSMFKSMIPYKSTNNILDKIVKIETNDTIKIKYQKLYQQIQFTLPDEIDKESMPYYPITYNNTNQEETNNNDLIIPLEQIQDKGKIDFIKFKKIINTVIENKEQLQEQKEKSINYLFNPNIQFNDKNKIIFSTNLILTNNKIDSNKIDTPIYLKQQEEELQNLLDINLPINIELIKESQSLILDKDILDNIIINDKIEFTSITFIIFVYEYINNNKLWLNNNPLYNKLTIDTDTNIQHSIFKDSINDFISNWFLTDEQIIETTHNKYKIDEDNTRTYNQDFIRHFVL